MRISTLATEAMWFGLNNPQIQNSVLAEKLDVACADDPLTGRSSCCFYRGVYLVAIRISDELLVVLTKQPFGIEKLLLTKNMARLAKRE